MAIDSYWEKMSGAVLVAVAAAVGNLLQGWDNATIAGTMILPYQNLSIIESVIILE